MRKNLIRMLSLAIILSCSIAPVFALDYYVNDRFDEKGMVSTSGKKIVISDSENLIGDIYSGFAFLQPAAWGGLKDETLAALNRQDDYVYVDYLPEVYKEIIEKMVRTADDDEWEALYSEMESNLIGVLCVYRMNSDELPISAEEYLPEFAHAELLAQVGKDSYYLSYNDQFPDCSLSENDFHDLAAIVKGADEIREGLMLYPQEEYDENYDYEYDEPPLMADMTSFRAVDMNGGEFTEKDFMPYDLTMINVWATYCGPCLSEMGELSKLKGSLTENVNLVTICSDASGNMQLAKELLSSVNAEFTTLADNDELREKLLDNVLGVPTTLFVDKYGNMVGEHIVGVPSAQDVAGEYLNEINSRLAAIK